MKRFVYYFVDNRDGMNEWGMDYWNAPNFRTAKKELFKAYKEELKTGLFSFVFIAEIKYEEDL